jgi:hypothetical protein
MGSGSATEVAAAFALPLGESRGGAFFTDLSGAVAFAGLAETAGLAIFFVGIQKSQSIGK